MCLINPKKVIRATFTYAASTGYPRPNK